MSDQVLYNVSSRTDNLEVPFIKRDLVYVNDNSAGNYNGQFLIETSAIANSGRWASYGESLLKIPYVVALSRSAAGFGAFRNNLQFGMKNGFHHIIHSFSVDYQGTNVVQLTPYSNFFVSFKMMTSWAQDDVVKYGGLCNFFPDTTWSTRYIQATANNNILNTDGLGFTNNRIINVALTDYVSTAYNSNILQQQAVLPFNEGYRKRLFNCNKVSTALNTGVVAQQINFANLQNLGSFYGNNNFPGDATEVAYVFHWATIRLKDLHSFFSELPLVKGAYLKILVNYNAGSSVITNSNNAAGNVITTIATTQQYGGSLPYMFSSAATNQPNAAPINAANVVASQTLASGIKQAPNQAAAPVGSIQCRLYVPLYTMAPQYEQQYISMNPTKTIQYRDIYNYVVYSVTAGSNFNNLLTNGIVNPKSLVIIPMADGQTNAAGKHVTTVALQPYQSPFATEPATPSFGAGLYNWNVQVSGVPLFAQNYQYDFETFCNELSKINAVNGGMTTGLSSGLIGEDDFSGLYRYYVADLSRGYKADDVVPKSILITGQNVSTLDVNLFCFIEYERSITIDIVTGAVIQV